MGDTMIEVKLIGDSIEFHDKTKGRGMFYDLGPSAISSEKDIFYWVRILRGKRWFSSDVELSFIGKARALVLKRAVTMFVNP
jgi:hypothetical protein